jgi:class 3 adenylate cyclase
MSQNASEVALLLADITDSTPLYEEVGDSVALGQIDRCLSRLRSIVAQEGGGVVRSKGDDVLCYFADASSAFKAARQMLSERHTSPLSIHAGAHFGPVIHAHGDIFGDAVNVTARLATLAKPGEALFSQKLVDRLPAYDLRDLRLLEHMTFKGKSAPVKVYSLLEDDPSQRTVIGAEHGSGHTRTDHQRSVPRVTATLYFSDHSRHCGESATLTIGRSLDCDVVIERPWVSRKHAVIGVRRGKVQLDDCSAAGTFVSIRDGYEFFMRRETVILTGSGFISPTLRPTDANAEVIRYEINRQGRKPRP